MEVNVARHYVAQQANGLSPLQQSLLDEPRRVRIVDAPTGAGKTYAFQKALLQQQRLLFIVPTRRLAQNIAIGLIDDLVKQAGWSRELAQRKVQIWSSDQTAVLREQGVNHIGGYRLQQMRELAPAHDGGEMIVATPETVSQLLNRPWLTLGQAGDSVFDFLDNFDHIVFDEFHTIEARGFGLAALFAKLATVSTEQGEVGYGCAKISLLSATPLAICPVLEKLGIASEHIAELHETITTQGRPLHGDVRLDLLDMVNMPAVLQHCASQVQAEVKQQRQVVIIYNALANLRRDLPQLAQQFQALGIAAQQVLVINSIDDSGHNAESSYGFAVGRQQDPDQFSILIATASVEMGVTFRAANLMLMEPGFAPMNFLQRYGRAARRGEDGAVYVRVDETLRQRQPWLRNLQHWVEEHQAQTVSIHELSQQLSASTQTRFSESETLYFGSLSQQAVYTSGLYWQVLLQHSSNQKHRGKHLRQHQPASSKHCYQLLQQLATMEADEDYQQAARHWRELLFQQALQLRDIGKRICVIEGDGRRLQVDHVWLQRETDIPQTLPLQTTADGKEEYFQLQGELDDYLLDNKNRAQRQLSVYFPHSQCPAELKADNSLLREWLALLKNLRDPDTEYAWDDHPKAMQAAEKLVSLSGLIPGGDVDISANISCGVLG